MKVLRYLFDVVVITCSIIGAGFAAGHGMAVYNRFVVRGCPCGTNCQCQPKCSNGCSQCPVIKPAD